MKFSSPSVKKRPPFISSFKSQATFIAKLRSSVWGQKSPEPFSARSLVMQVSSLAPLKVLADVC